MAVEQFMRAPNLPKCRSRGRIGRCGLLLLAASMVSSCESDPRSKSRHEDRVSEWRKGTERMVTSEAASTPAPGTFDRPIEPVDPRDAWKAAPTATPSEQR